MYLSIHLSFNLSTYIYCLFMPPVLHTWPWILCLYYTDIFNTNTALIYRQQLPVNLCLTSLCHSHGFYATDNATGKTRKRKTYPPEGHLYIMCEISFILLTLRHSWFLCTGLMSFDVFWCRLMSSDVVWCWQSEERTEQSTSTLQSP